MPKAHLPNYLHSFIDLREAEINNEVREFGESDYYYFVNVIDKDGKHSVMALTRFDVAKLIERGTTQTEAPRPAGKWRTIWALLTNKIRCS